MPVTEMKDHVHKILELVTGVRLISEQIQLVGGC